MNCERFDSVDMNNKQLDAALSILQLKLKPLSGSWLVGGSCGLMLQGMPLDSPPRDLDIYVDATEVNKVHNSLKHYAVDQLQFSETPRYQSMLSHYHIGDVTVECVGNFCVRHAGSRYQVSIASCLFQHRACVSLGGEMLYCMPLAHELVFNILREREDRYMAIASMMSAEKQRYLPALIEIIQNNQFSEFHLNQLRSLLQHPLEIESEPERN